MIVSTLTRATTMAVEPTCRPLALGNVGTPFLPVLDAIAILFKTPLFLCEVLVAVEDNHGDQELGLKRVYVWGDKKKSILKRRWCRRRALSQQWRSHGGAGASDSPDAPSRHNEKQLNVSAKGAPYQVTQSGDSGGLLVRKFQAGQQGFRAAGHRRFMAFWMLEALTRIFLKIDGRRGINV